jgi:threonine 3-dehydrogenase
MCELHSSSAKESAVENFEKTGGNIKRILVTGGGGQIGSELTLALREKFGAENVIVTDLIRDRDGDQSLYEGGPFSILDVTNRQGVLEVLREHRADTVVHLAALLSARGEKDPELAWNINVTGTLNVLSCARDLHLTQVFIPSSIAVFGAGTPKDRAPNDTLLIPSTIYGISKVAGELLGNYYVSRFGLDVRGLRYPGIISAKVMPKGGTTDFAAEMFWAALKEGRYTCFVREDTRLPMMYMNDCIKATLDLMAAPYEQLVHHTDFNISGMSFSAKELAEAIRKHVPNFECRFEPDHRQAIADSWPYSLDDTPAREEWGWRPSFTLETMVADMIDTLKQRFQEEKLPAPGPEPLLSCSVRPSRPSFYPRLESSHSLHR